MTQREGKKVEDTHRHGRTVPLSGGKLRAEEGGELEKRSEKEGQRKRRRRRERVHHEDLRREY